MSGPRRPAPGLVALEHRALFEFGEFLASAPVLRALGRGDRHPVLVLPGFTAGDRSTMPLRSILRSQGYWVHGWGLGRNLGPTDHILRGAPERLAVLHERHHRKVSLIGWSMGGLLARWLGREYPESVRQVITLGSPFRLRDEQATRAAALWLRVKSAHRLDRSLETHPPEESLPPLEVPATAIFTRTDGVVHWSRCIESQGPLRENIEVWGSHSGLGHNPAAVYAISDRLRQPEGSWTPFTPPSWLRFHYRPPTYWRPAPDSSGAGSKGAVNSWAPDTRPHERQGRQG